MGNEKGIAVTLVLINWIDGSLSTESAYYTLGKEDYSVYEEKTKRVSFAVRGEEDLKPLYCYQNKEAYSFRKIESIPFPLKRRP